MGAVAEQGCEPGYYSDGGVAECAKCKRGTHAAVDGDINICADAPAGSSAPFEGLLLPIACDPGTFAATPGMANCEECPEGEFQPETGATGCNICPAGNYNPRKGAVACVKCPRGEFTNAVGQPRCSACAIGEFSDEQGSTACTSCTAVGIEGGENLNKLTTKESGADAREKCVCQKAYHRLTQAAAAPGAAGDDASGGPKYACQKCEEGLFCPIGADAELNLGTWMKVRPGYFVVDRKFDEVYQCDLLVLTGRRGTNEFPEGYVSDDSSASSRCPGPTGPECAEGRTGMLCGRCKDGFYKTEKGKCESCGNAGASGDSTLILIILLVIVVLMPFLGHKLLNANAMEQSGILMVQMALGVLLTTTQLANVVTKVALEWPAWVDEFLEVLTALALNMQVLPFACVFNSDAGTTRYLGLVIMIPAIFGWIFFASFLSRAFKKGSAWRIETPDAVNIFGMAYQSLFVLIVSWVIAPFRSFAHASEKLEGTMHLAAYPDVEVGSADHGMMIALAAFAFLAYTVTFVTFYVYQIVSMPERAASCNEERNRILRSLRFIFLRFRPARWYWGGVLIVRNFLCACVSFFPPDQAFIQLLVLFLVLQIYLVVQVRRWPWFSGDLNMVDAMQSLSLLGMTGCCLTFSGIPSSKTTADTAATALLVFYIAGAVFIFCWILVGLFKYNSAAISQQKVKSEIEKVSDCIDEVQTISKCVQLAGDASMYQVLKDLDIEDIERTRDVCEGLRNRLTGSGAGTRSGRRLSVFPRGVTSPGRSMHIHRKKHGAKAAVEDPVATAAAGQEVPSAEGAEV